MNAGRYRALLLDLDGTLLDRSGRLGERNRAAVREASRRGLEVWIATGRSISGMRRVYEALGLSTPACCYNGAVLVCGASGRWLRHHPLEDALLAEVVDFALSRSLFFVVDHEGSKYSVGAGSPGAARLLALVEGVRLVPRAGIPGRGATRVSLAGEPDDVDAFEERFRGRPHYAVRFPVALIPGFEALALTVLDLHAPCRGKAEAIRFLEDERGIAPAEVIAIGDHENDLPMIREAGLGVAVANAPDEVKRAARVVIGHHDEDAVALFLESVLG